MSLWVIEVPRLLISLCMTFQPFSYQIYQYMYDLKLPNTDIINTITASLKNTVKNDDISS